jgi:hypothetical protein
MFLAKNAPAKKFPPIRKKIRSEESSGEECSWRRMFLAKNPPARKVLSEEFTGEKYYDEELS